MDNWAWEDMLAEFRALGGVADNVRLGTGASGRGLFPIDPTRLVRVSTPPNLLIGPDQIAFEGGALLIPDAAAVGAREARFVERYYEAFSWGGGGREETATCLDALHELPAHIQTTITTEFMAGRLFRGREATDVERRFLATRVIRWRGARVLAPLVELANHAPGGARYEADGGPGLSGRCAGELLARYRRADALLVFLGWGFASPEPLALSLPAFVKLGDRILVVRRDLSGWIAPDAESAPPTVDANGRFVDMARLLVADSSAPGRPRAMFAQLMRPLGAADPDSVFDEILAINRERFEWLQSSAAAVEGAGADLVRRVCSNQLDALATDPAATAPARARG